MRKFIKSSFLFLSPFFIVITIYIALDPFMVIKKYDTFYNTDAKGCVGLNREYVSTTTFDWNYKKEHYNSFIFGNSCSIFYQVADWKKNLKGDANCYHFDASGETLYALTKKVKYIDTKNIKIKNALLVIDDSTLAQDQPRTGHLVAVSPQLENNKNLFSFHYENFKAFIYPSFIYAYLDFKLSGKVKPYMMNLIEDIPRVYDVNTNEFRLEKLEELIRKGEFYTGARKKIFYQRDTIQKFSSCAIAENQKILLQEIFDVFNRHKTNYKIIINPLYSQIKLNNEDFKYLVQLFGQKNVFDFSGINKFTNDYNNYYETVHYRPHVAREIMALIYQNEQSTGGNKDNIP
jgi:hypothetical protein